MEDDEAAPKKRKGQVRPKVREALALIVTKGASITDAAQTVSMTREALSRALKRPAVLAAKADLVRAWHESEREQAWLVVADLQRNSASDDCRLRAARTILEAFGDLTPKNNAPPMPGVAVQIIVGTGSDRREVMITDGAGCGVVELPPYSPAPIEADE